MAATTPGPAPAGLAAVGLPAGAGLGGGLGRVEAGRHGDRPRAVRRLRGHGSGARARPLRVMRDGLAAVPVHVHPNTATVLLLILGEPIPALQPILYGQTGQVDAGADHPLVVVRVDADAVRLQIKCILTVLYILQLVLVEVGPPPDPGVDYMRESLPCGHLQPPIQRPGDGDALGGLSSARGDGGYQTVQLISLLLQLLDEGLYCSLAECFALSALSVAHQTVHDGEASVGRGRSVGRHLPYSH